MHFRTPMDVLRCFIQGKLRAAFVLSFATFSSCSEDSRLWIRRVSVVKFGPSLDHLSSFSGFSRCPTMQSWRVHQQANQICWPWVSAIMAVPKAIPTAPSATSAPAMLCRSPAFREGGNVESVAAKETMSFTGYSRVSNVGTSLFIIDDHHFWWLKHSEACWASVLAQFYQMSCWILTCRQNQWSA